MRNVLFVISGPSGVGKGTLVDMLMAREEGLAESVSCTTRPPREGEKDGVDYFFISQREFDSRIAEKDFLEYDEHFGNKYGTPRSFVERQLKLSSVILEIDVVGGLNAKRLKPDAVLIMIVPPSLEALAARLAARGSETAEALGDRMQRVKYELEQQDLYDYVVVNDDLERAYETLKNIIDREREKGETK